MTTLNDFETIRVAKNRWAAGIRPQRFCWILRGQLAISERPGGVSRTHRRVRRQEEIVWLKQEGFNRVVSTLPTEHNLHAYAELDMLASHRPVSVDDDLTIALPKLYFSLHEWVCNGEKILLHREEVSEELLGILAGYLHFSRRVATKNQALSIIEHMFRTPIGPRGQQFLEYDAPRN